MRLGLFFLFLQSALMTASASTAMRIVEWNPAVIDVVAYDPTAPPHVFDTAYLPTLPTSGSLSAVSGGVSTSADFSLSSAGIDLTFIHARNQFSGAGNSTFVQVPFFADTSVDFVLSGMVSADDPDGRFIKLRAYLRDYSTGDYLFITETSSLSTPNETLTLGLPNGE